MLPIRGHPDVVAERAVEFGISKKLFTELRIRRDGPERVEVDVDEVKMTPGREQRRQMGHDSLCRIASVRQDVPHHHAVPGAGLETRVLTVSSPDLHVLEPERVQLLPRRLAGRMSRLDTHHGALRSDDLGDLGEHRTGATAHVGHACARDDAGVLPEIGLVLTGELGHQPIAHAFGFGQLEGVARLRFLGHRQSCRRENVTAVGLSEEYIHARRYR
jgi:hypothetical protein